MSCRKSILQFERGFAAVILLMHAVRNCGLLRFFFFFFVMMAVSSSLSLTHQIISLVGFDHFFSFFPHLLSSFHGHHVSFF